MKLGREFRLLVFLFVLTLFAQSAIAVPIGDKFLFDSLEDVTFMIGTGAAEVDCEVYNYTSGDYADKYLYTYQISNIDSGIGLKFFSVGIRDGANAYDPDFDSVPGGVDPVLWATSDSSLQSVDATFTVPVREGDSSAILWYISDYEPATSEGALYGTASGIPYYTSGNVLTPAPEPATIFLLGIGVAMMTLSRKRLHA